MLNIVRAVGSDMRRSCKAITNLLRYIYKDQKLTQNDFASISLFRASSFQVQHGLVGQYTIVISAPEVKPCYVRLLIDVYQRDNPIHPQGHYAFAVKDLVVGGRATTSLIVEYDWDSSMTFICNGISLLPDDYWRGSCDRSGMYRVTASIMTREGVPLESLALTQELIP